MGVQVLSDRKVRRAARETGLDLDRVVCAGNRVWLGRVETPVGHFHVRIDPVTWEHTGDVSSCWTSCETPCWTVSPWGYRARVRA